MAQCCCMYRVTTANVAIVESLGKFDHLGEPGCHCLNCVTNSVRGVVSLRVQQIRIHVDTKTRDNALVRVAASVLYRVLEDRVQEAFYRFSNAAAQIESYASNVIRGQVPNHTIDEIFVTRDEMQKALRTELEEQMATYGFRIVATLITDIDPSNEIKMAMSQINTNARLRLAAEYEADAKKIKVVMAAEADAEAKRLSGVGLAEQRKALVNGLQSSVHNFTHAVEGMTSRDVMSLLLVNQYFDALRDVSVAGRTGVVLLPGTTSSEVLEGVLAADRGRLR